MLGDGDVVPLPRPGRAWCPTPRALRRLEKAGAIPVPAPDFAVLRRVNHRRFSAELGQTLPGACFVATLAELTAVVAGESPSGQWLLKRPFGFAGRGRRRVARGRLDATALGWVQASLRTGEGLQVEPWVERIADYGLHGFRVARRHDHAGGADTANVRRKWRVAGHVVGDGPRCRRDGHR